MSEAVSTKETIREQMRHRRHEIGHEERRAAGIAVCEKVLGHPINLLLRTWRVCLYLSSKHEIPTRYIMRAIWEVKHETCVPAWSTSERAYRPYAMGPHTQLIVGRHGIREPAVRDPVEPWDVEAFILPGLAFDTCGGRLGYGAGHYDTMLGKSVRMALKIAICYDWQVLETPLPQEPHDVPMDWIVTDKRVIDCAANRQLLTQTRSPS